MGTIELTNRRIAGTYSRVPIVIKGGRGSILVDEGGREYIDFGSGIAVNVFGMGDGLWHSAVCGQAAVLHHCSNHYYSQPQAELAELLCQRSGMEEVFFSNSGAEANECAIKAARKYSMAKYGPGRHGVVTLAGSFHGRTLGALSATGQEALQAGFGPLVGGFSHVPPNDLAAMQSALGAGGVCAVMVEAVQGEGGVRPLDGAYLRAVERLCSERDVLLIADEVQSGNGRTGKYFAYMHHGVQPDVVTTAKALAGGLPMGATLFGPKAKGALAPGSHGSTFGGNPVCAAAALSIVSRIDEGLMQSVWEKGQYMMSRLGGAPGVRDVTGLGLMVGAQPEKDIKQVLELCRERGLLVLSAKQRLRLLPALNIPMELLEKGMDILLAALRP